MADVKISGLPASTTPLAGTEVLPVVQGGVTKQVSVANLTAGRAVSASSATITGNLTFTGTGNRITGDFNNATLANRVAFQNSAANSETAVVAFPNGTSTTTRLGLYTTNDGVNASALTFNINSAANNASIQSAITGTGTYLPLLFFVGGAQRMQISTAGNVFTTEGSTTMSAGFFYIPAADGAPTGAPPDIGGRVPMYYDRTNNQFYVYNGSWKKVTLS
jgi:VCBS repeat-containing protein